jgi:tetratricopeptide (TPR) repeat protein
MEEATLQHGLEQLVDAELLYQRGQPPQATYTFKHALVQDTAYQSLLRSTRQQYHQRIAQVLESQFPETVETQPELLAHHTLCGEVWDRALIYCRQAGEKALAQSAHREAAGYFEQAISVLQHLPEMRDTREQAIDLRLALRTALRLLGDDGRILAVLREAESLAVALNDPRRLGQVYGSLLVDCFSRGAHDQAIDAGERALTLATASGDAVLHAVVALRLGQAYSRQTNYRRAIDYLKQALTFFDGTPRRERFGLPNPPAVLSRVFLSWCYSELGMFVEGSTVGKEGLRIAEAVAYPSSVMLAAWGIGRLHFRQGDLPTALPLLERAVGICHEADLPGYFPDIAATLGAAYALSGRVADAVPLLAQAIERSIATRMAHYETHCRLSLGETQLLAGRLEEAYALTEQALALAREHQEHGNQAYALRLLGDIAARREPSERDQAEAYYRQALAMAGELGMRPLQAHSHRSLGTLYATTGQTEQARVELSTALEMYRAMDMTFWLPQTEAVLAQEKGR